MLNEREQFMTVVRASLQINWQVVQLLSMAEAKGAKETGILAYRDELREIRVALQLATQINASLIRVVPK